MDNDTNVSGLDAEVKQTSKTKKAKAKKSAKAKKGSAIAEAVKAPVKKEYKDANITVFKDTGIKTADSISIEKGMLVIKDRNKTAIFKKLPKEKTLEITGISAVSHAFRDADLGYYFGINSSTTQSFKYDSDKDFKKHIDEVLKVVKGLVQPDTQFRINETPVFWDDIEEEVKK